MVSIEVFANRYARMRSPCSKNNSTLDIKLPCDNNIWLLETMFDPL
jgi:hypothetical protein